jgi:hypothetical protein
MVLKPAAISIFCSFALGVLVWDHTREVLARWTCAVPWRVAIDSAEDDQYKGVRQGRPCPALSLSDKFQIHRARFHFQSRLRRSFRAWPHGVADSWGSASLHPRLLSNAPSALKSTYLRPQSKPVSTDQGNPPPWFKHYNRHRPLFPICHFCCGQPA